MVQIPDELAQAIKCGDCVLWAGAGFGALAGRPGWAELLGKLIPRCPEGAQAQLRDLLEQGRLRTVLSYIHRHLGDDPLAKLLSEVSSESDGKALAAGSERLGELPWCAYFATTYADVLYGILSEAGRSVDVLSHTDVHHLSLRDQEQGFILRTPPTGRSMRADAVFFDLVEEVVRTRRILFLGFDIDDPDLYQILDLLGRVGRGNKHYAWLPFVTDAEAEEMREQYGIHVIQAPAEVDLPDAFARLAAAANDATPRPSDAEGDFVILDLARALRAVDVRADLAIDVALALDVGPLEQLITALPGAGNLSRVDPGTLLRTGAAMWAHGRFDRARKCFQQVISRGAGREYEQIARFNLAVVAASDGDTASATQGFSDAAEANRTLALVPPKFQIVEVYGWGGTQMMVSCSDRETREQIDIDVATLARPVGRHEEERFHKEVHELSEISHPTIKPVRGGFADGRLFGVMTEPAPGFVLADTLRDADPMDLSRAAEIVSPLLEGLGVCHIKGIVHRNIQPKQILLGPSGAMLRGFGFLPVVSYQRSSVRAENWGYMAPELAEGGEASPQSDVYAVAAVLYRCLTGAVPSGSMPSANAFNEGLDSRIDGVLRAALHPDSSRRPSAIELQGELGRILTTAPAAATTPLRPTPRDVPVAAEPIAAAPVAVEAGAPTAVDEAVSAPAGLKILPPDDPNDLEAWAWILERKPTHLEARDAIERIERESRSQGRWDRVAEVLQVRAQHTQVQAERLQLLRELATLFEHDLGAPANAFATLQSLLDDVPVPTQLELVDELSRLAGVSGNWAELADSISIVAARAGDPSQQGKLYGELGHIFAEQLGAADRAIVAFERATTLAPDSHADLSALAPLYRRAGRHAELTATLLSLADLEAGNLKEGRLIEAARLLHDELGDPDGAFATIQALRDESPDHAEALEMADRLARELEHWDTLIAVLSKRAEGAFDDADAAGLRREAAQIAIEHLANKQLAIEQYTQLLDRDRSDRESAKLLVGLLRDLVKTEPGQRVALIDALSVLVDLVEVVDERVQLLAECAALLDQEPDGADRAVDCREQILSLLVPDRPVAKEAGEALERYYRNQESMIQLAELYVRQGQAKDAEPDFRIAAWAKLLELRVGPLNDDGGAIEALEALTQLAPDNKKWRDDLLKRYLDRGEFELAGPLIRAQVFDEPDPKRKAELLVRGGKLRHEIGKIEGAIEALEEGVSLDPEATDGWVELRELYEKTGQPIKALDAQVAAARSTNNRLERTRMLFEAARDCIDRLDKPDRAVPLLEEVVELDPDHRDATGMLLDRLITEEDLARAWPIAQTFVMQVRSQAPNDQALNLRALSLAGRCALAVDDRDKAREYLEKARGLDATNIDVTRLLADLNMDAERWDEALRNYQSVVLGAGDKIAPSEQAALYVQMARARIGMGEQAKAVPMAERALDLDGDNEGAARMLIELAEANGGAADIAKAKRRLADQLGRREEALDEEAGKPVRAERVELLRGVAALQGDQLNLPEEAVRTLEQVLELQPGDPSVLHNILDLFTSTKRWLDATRVLERLAGAQQSDATRAKYLYAGGVILRDEIGDLDAALSWLRNAVQKDPHHDRAFAASTEIMRKQGAWHDLTKVLRQHLKTMPDSVDLEERVRLLEELGQIYEEKLDDRLTALAAYEQAVLLSPSGAANEETMLERRRRVMGLAIELGSDQIDKAISQAHAIIKVQPMEFAIYHQLVEQYSELGHRDAAACVARALRFLRQATDQEKELADKLGEGPAQAKSTVTRDLWRTAVYHFLENPRLSDLFSIIWPMVAAREGRTHAHFGVKRDQRREITMQSPDNLPKYLAYACQILDAPVPDLFVREGEAGGIVITALADTESGQVKTVYPSVLAGAAAMANAPEPVWSFRAARVAARARPEHILASVLPSGASLRNAVFGAVAITHPGVAIPEDSQVAAKAYGKEIQRYLPPARIEQLKGLVGRVVEGGGADTRAWVQGVDYTVTRTGFLLANNLETAVRILTQEGDEGSVIPAKDRIKDVVAYSVSEPYLKLRKALGIAI